MRKKLFYVSLILALIVAAFGGGVYAASKLTLVVNGVKAGVDPILHNNATYIPVRAAAELLEADVKWDQASKTATVTSREVVTLVFPADKYPETAAHIAAAIQNGHPAVCTIDRDGADDNRSKSLAGIPTISGYDRDEWPMAMCAEGGAGASVAYVELSDNRGAGSWVGNALEEYPDGTKVAFAILGIDTKGVQLIETEKPKEPVGSVVYNSCAEAKAAGAAPIYKGEPGYSAKLDRDGDGVACET